jgi:hypothetical protein
MAEPTGYSVSYSFAGWQATNPADPLPAAPVDTEFENIETSIASIVAALNEVRRSDGFLMNGIVGLDQLDEQLAALVGGDPRILVSDLNPASFATQTQAEVGAANDRLMTPLRTKQAIDAQRAYASQAEAEAGVEATHVMTPATVAQALGTLRAYASKAEAEAGEENTKVMTALRVLQAIAAQRTVYSATQSITWGTIGTLAASTQSVNVAGAAVGDKVVVGYPAAGLNDGLRVRAWVSSADTVSIRAYNTTGSGITPTAAQSYKVTVLHF